MAEKNSGDAGDGEPRGRIHTPGVQETEVLYRSVIAAMSEGVVIQNADTEILAFNDSALEILGLTEDQIAGRTSFDPAWRAVHEDGSPFPGEEHPSIATLRSGKPAIGVIMGVHKPNGDLRWISINTRPLFRDKDAKPHQVVCTFLDITERRKSEERLISMARSDSLTGLANRSHFLEELSRAVARAQRHRRTIGLLYLDLDGFKAVNDSLGHTAGDTVLRTVAERLRACLRRSDFIARLGGDEFTVIMEELPEEHSTIVGDKIIKQIALPIPVNGREVKVGVSIGLALFPSCGASPEALLHSADAAMYAAKRSGRGRVCMATAL